VEHEVDVRGTDVGHRQVSGMAGVLSWQAPGGHEAIQEYRPPGSRRPLRGLAMTEWSMSSFVLVVEI
jgi:hypothetical protein